MRPIQQILVAVAVLFVWTSTCRAETVVLLCSTHAADNSGDGGYQFTVDTTGKTVNGRPAKVSETQIDFDLAPAAANGYRPVYSISRLDLRIAVMSQGNLVETGVCSKANK